MGKRVDRLAGEFVTAMLARAGVTKSAGTAAQFMPYAVGLAESVVAVEKALKRSAREMERHAAEVGRLVDANGERIDRLAESYAASMVPGAVEVERGYRDLDLQRFRVGLVDRQAQAPVKANGHGSHGDGPAPAAAPLWHPENDGN